MLRPIFSPYAHVRSLPPKSSILDDWIGNDLKIETMHEWKQKVVASDEWVRERFMYVVCVCVFETTSSEGYIEKR